MNYIEVYFNGILKHSLPLESELVSIGRSPNNDIIIDNMGVSNHHAVISKQDDFFYIEDLYSTNGTFLNEEKISAKQKIDSQDTISIGKHSIKFSEWGRAQTSATSSPNLDTTDETIMVGRQPAQAAESKPSEKVKPFYLTIRGEVTGIKKLLLTENNYGIGKNKKNAIRIGGWFTSAYIAEIDKIGHSFYINPLKKNKVKVNNKIVNASTLLSNTDEIKIKKLTLRFLSDSE